MKSAALSCPFAYRTYGLLAARLYKELFGARDGPADKLSKPEPGLVSREQFPRYAKTTLGRPRQVDSQSVPVFRADSRIIPAFGADSRAIQSALAMIASE